MSRNEVEDGDFKSLGIIPGLLKRIDALGFVHPTPIQHQAIPVATSGQDVIGIAQTGSGKTLAFAIPILQTVSKTKKTGLVLLPTRELAVQVEETFRKVAGNSGLRPAIIIGGTSPHSQTRALRNKPHVIVATPGRLIDHLERGRVNFRDLGMLVLDEADRMLDMGFAPQLKRILETVPKDRQTMLFSATMPPAISKIASDYMKTPLRIEVAAPGTTADKIEQEMIIVPGNERMDLLKKILKEHEGSVLIFSRTKHGAKKIARDIRNMGISADEIHSNRSQNQRQHALKGFSAGKYRVLVATDIAARGIDVDHLSLVINFDLPEQLEDYVHRIGRTGRAGREGKSISFAAPGQRRDILIIEKLINKTLEVKSHTGEVIDRSNDKPSAGGYGGGRGRGGGGRSGGKRSFGGRSGGSKSFGGRSSGGKRSGDLGGLGRSTSGARSGGARSGSGRTGGKKWAPKRKSSGGHN